MEALLRFNPEKYEVKSCEIGGRSITYRAYEGISYCTMPQDSIQKLNIFVPERYYQNEKINGYTLKTAPIFAHNTVGGYMPGAAGIPEKNPMTGEPNAIFDAIEHGYVVAAAGVRGRSTGRKSQEFFVGSTLDEQDGNLGKMVGKAPAFIVDMKAAIRYLRHNKDVIPGNTERIITNGTSAGGALSALAGATGNHQDYEPYLKEIGAADERDDIFVASCYCPIHNLENADAAYEWLFEGHNDFHYMKFSMENGEIKLTPLAGMMTEEQITTSKELKTLFPDYVNSLGLKDEQGTLLTMNADGTGSFREYVKKNVMQAAQMELDTHFCEEHVSGLMLPDSKVEDVDFLTIENGKVVDMDWEKYVCSITRMKAAPAFDSLDLTSPENDEFGSVDISAKHFTKYGYEHSKVSGTLADEQIIKMLNPTKYLKDADVAKHWWIRHGSYDRDTSIAIPIILETMLKNQGIDVNFNLPWGLPHSGDYDTQELFAWVDSLK